MSKILEPKIINKIKYVLEKEEKIQKIILFGSRAKETAQNGSDIDIALSGTDIKFKDLCKFSVKLDELELPYRIDVISYEGLKNKDLKEHIDRVGVIL